MSGGKRTTPRDSWKPKSAIASTSLFLAGQLERVEYGLRGAGVVLAFARENADGAGEVAF